MSKGYIELEQHIINIFNTEKTFSIGKDTYNVVFAGKPRPSDGHGECKTDVFVMVQNLKNQYFVLKISVKRKSNNEFQENKMTAEKAEAYFGQDWSNIIKKATTSLKKEFENKALIYQSGRHPTKPNSITLGWKLEIANKSRNLSVKAPLSDTEIRNYVFKGTNQIQSKKDAIVNNNIIKDSGVADYLLSTEIEDINSIDDVINQLKYIDNMSLPPIYLIFTANNYRTDVDKADGPRSLAVYINWTCINNKLTPNFVYDSPLLYTGQNDIKPILISALDTLGKRNPQDFDINNDVSSTKIIVP